MEWSATKPYDWHEPGHGTEPGTHCNLFLCWRLLLCCLGAMSCTVRSVDTGSDVSVAVAAMFHHATERIYLEVYPVFQSFQGELVLVLLVSRDGPGVSMSFRSWLCVVPVLALVNP